MGRQQGAAVCMAGPPGWWGPAPRARPPQRLATLPRVQEAAAVGRRARGRGPGAAAAQEGSARRRNGHGHGLCAATHGHGQVRGSAAGHAVAVPGCIGLLHCAARAARADEEPSCTGDSGSHQHRQPHLTRACSLARRRPMMGGGRPPRERTPPGRMPPGPVGGRDAGRDAGRDFRDRDRDRVGDRDRERKREREPTPPRCMRAQGGHLACTRSGPGALCASACHQNGGGGARVARR